MLCSRHDKTYSATKDLNLEGSLEMQASAFAIILSVPLLKGSMICLLADEVYVWIATQDTVFQMS